jgi:hypothetical protein
MKISDKLSRLKSIDLNGIFDDSLRANEDAILDLNRDQMYEEGTMDVNKPGQTLQYAESTKKAKRKAPFNRTDFITLKWTGKLHKALKLLIFKDKFVISNTDKVYGNYIEPQTRFQSAIGLTEESKSQVRDMVKDNMIKSIRQQLNNLK